jgi:Rv0078B-related antitoxin
MENIKELGEQIFRDRVLRERQMDPAAKLSAGFELFEFACGISRAGIRHQYPQAGDAEVERILAERLALQRRLEVGKWKSKR